MNFIVQFKREHLSWESPPEKYLKVTDHKTGNQQSQTHPNDFIIKNYTTGNTFNPDRYQITDNSNIRFCIDFNKNDFTKVINKDDVVRWLYEPRTPDQWPSTIKDACGGCMVSYKRWQGQDFIGWPEKTSEAKATLMGLSGEVDFEDYAGTANNPEDLEAAWKANTHATFSADTNTQYPHFVKGWKSEDTKKIHIKFFLLAVLVFTNLIPCHKKTRAAEQNTVKISKS